MGGVIGGLNHLWFLTAIALCYAITPVLQFIRRYSELLLWIEVCLVILWLTLIYLPIGQSQLTWLVLYSLGYFIAKTTPRERFLLSLIAVCYFSLLMTDFSWTFLLEPYWSLKFHISLAIILFLFGKYFFRKLKIKKIPWSIRELDYYSFHIYIVHHVLIFPPFSMLQVTGWEPVNIIIIILYILFFSWILALVSDKVTFYVESHRKSKSFEIR